jgi:TonB-linked SusC/RagA family outer membrane protein
MKTTILRIFSMFLLISSQLVMAQQTTVTGSVSDENGLPLPGVNVIVEGTSNGTQSDFDGNYSINTSVGQTLVFSYLSYTTANRPVTAGSNVISIAMEPDAEALGEVIVNAIGLKRKKEDDLSSATLVPIEAVTRSGESGVLQGLAGKTSGVNITKSSGDPGAGAYIQIRGANSISGSDEPLIVLDGVLIDNRNFESGVDGVTEQSRLNDIASEDIASIQIYKGAQAVAIYGTGAANGVIVIETKTGKSSGSSWSLDYKTGMYVDTVNREWDLQTKFGQGNNGAYDQSASTSYGDKISDRSGAADGVIIGNQRFESRDGRVYYPYADRVDGSVDKNSQAVYVKSNRDAILGTGYSFENSLSLQKSTENGSTYISANSWKQNGVIRGGSDYYRRSFRFNNSTKFDEKLSGRISANYTKTTADQVQFGSNLNGLYLGYLRTPADFDNSAYIGTAYNAAGQPTLNAQRGYRNFLGPIPTYNNPLWTAKEQSNTTSVDRFLITPELTYKFNDNMSVTARYNVDTYRDKREQFFPVNSATNQGSGAGFFDSNHIFSNSQYLTAFINSNHAISEDFTFNWVLGATYEERSLEQVGGTLSRFQVSDIDLNDLIDLSNGLPEDISIRDSYSYSRQVGTYAVLDFEVFNQILIQASGRVDQSSTLPDQNFYYPGLALGWKFTEAIGESDFLSFGKLRASYGEVAVAPLNYSLSTDFNIGGGVSSSWGDSLNGASLGGATSRANQQGNPNLLVERVKEVEVGADLKFFNNRVSTGFTYYDRETEDVIIGRLVSPATGFTSLLSNAANITNKGIEADISATLVNSDNFKWTINANYSMNENLVTGPDTEEGDVIDTLNGFTGSAASVVDGSPFSVIYGSPLYRDLDSGELILNDFGFPQLDPTGATPDRVLGDPNPEWRAGLGTTIEYKNFRLSAQFDAVQGNDVWNGTRGVLNHFGVSQETANEVTVSAAEAITIVNYQGTAIQDLPNAQQNDDGSYTVRGNLEDFGAGTVLLDQAYYNGGTGSGFNGATEPYIEDASYVKLRELTLGYSFSNKAAKRIGMRSLDISISGRNLITWSDIEGFDPDNNLTGASKGRGLEYFTNPSTSSYSFIVRIGL